MALKTFSLEGKGLKLDTAEDLAKHIQKLKDDDEVEEVRFLGNTLGVGACEALAEVLKTKQKLQVANLTDIFTARLLSEIPPALDALLKALLTLPSLHTVHLADNAFGLNTVQPLIDFLCAHTPLEHLILNNNGMGPIAGTQLADALTTLAQKKKEKNAPLLRTVICGRNRLENGSMEAWARAYAAHPGVQEVKMVQNGIRQEGITLLLRDGLKHATGIQTLDLQDNTFTVMGAKALTDILSGFAEIKELALSDCYLKKRGGLMLAEKLREGNNKKLEVLRMQYNDVDAKCVKALADALDELPKLRRIELNGNMFSEDDVNIERIQETLSERKEGVEDADDDDWGLDELDELDDDEDDEEEEDNAVPSDDDDDDEGEQELKKADEAEEENVAQEKDKSVDELADMMGKTAI
ncbi:RNI-like protein [Aulographum hederae CBS 113979]|uniref:RNI-like protein n=1 Tax=Aulographum hederae CBS 113979 TaxID=1176131 RepID=A0A6G1GZA6_9PEZI|nr:RNI-like protein [Aulographum hederae CBS 113979]